MRSWVLGPSKAPGPPPAANLWEAVPVVFCSLGWTQNEKNSDFNKEIFNDVNENEITLLPKQKELEVPNEVYTLANHEKNLIKKSLERHKGKRKLAAEELGISERTLYRKIKEFSL